VAQAPDRLLGAGSVDISRPMDAIKEIRRCVKELGFKAIRVLGVAKCCSAPNGR
jgi:uncharacterized protein